jgi:hypothetical protein
MQFDLLSKKKFVPTIHMLNVVDFSGAEQQCERIGPAAYMSSNLEYSFYCSSILHQYIIFFPYE